MKLKFFMFLLVIGLVVLTACSSNVHTTTNSSNTHNNAESTSTNQIAQNITTDLVSDNDSVVIGSLI